ncbi:MAG: hypothetical protein COA88_12825 [Kordia sp.]|nr:MAG: hypothetical protein COA88_12825 [Kordia sp.]
MNRKAIVFSLVIISFLSMITVQRCSNDNALVDQQVSFNALMEFKDAELKQTIRSEGLKAQESLELRQNIVSDKIAREYMVQQFRDYQRVQSLVKAELLTEIRNLKIEYGIPNTVFSEFEGISMVDSQYIHKDTVSMYFLRIPKRFNWEDQWMSISGTIDKNFILDSLKMVNKFDVTLGYKKPDKSFKWLRKSEPVLEFNSYNPYSTVPYINNLVVKKEKKGLARLATSRGACIVYAIALGITLNKNSQ